MKEIRLCWAAHFVHHEAQVKDGGLWTPATEEVRLLVLGDSFGVAMARRAWDVNQLVRKGVRNFEIGEIVAVDMNHRLCIGAQRRPTLRSRSHLQFAELPSNAIRRKAHGHLEYHY